MDNSYEHTPDRDNKAEIIDMLAYYYMARTPHLTSPHLNKILVAELVAEEVVLVNLI